MKTILALFFFTLLFLQGASQTIQNAGFEKGDTSGWVFTNPAYYKTATDPGYTCTVVRDAEEGKCAAQLANTGQGIWCQLRQKIFYSPAADLEKVRLSAYVKTKGIHKGFATLSVRPSRKGKPLPFTEGTKMDGTQGWKRIYVDVIVPKGADSLSLFCSMTGDGVAWFDDIRLETSADPISQSAAAKQYLDTALAVIGRTALYKDSVDFGALYDDARLMCADAKATADCYNAIVYVLQGLGDRHSFFLTPDQAKQEARNDGTTIEMPSGKRIDGTIGYVKVPPIRALNDTLVKAYAQTMQRVIRSLDSKSIIGWVVDNRNNTGGNAFPMVLGLGPLIGNGVADRRIINGIVVDSSGYRDGEWWGADGYSLKIDSPYTLIRQHPGVAVLTNGRVGSSGESVVLRFKHRPKAMIFGEPTYGLTTANQEVELSDGAMMFITAGKQNDRLGNEYGGKIYPDKPVVDDPNTKADEVIEAAVKWLKNGTNL